MLDCKLFSEVKLAATIVWSYATLTYMKKLSGLFVSIELINEHANFEGKHETLNQNKASTRPGVSFFAFIRMACVNDSKIPFICSAFYNLTQDLYDKLQKTAWVL